MNAAAFALLALALCVRSGYSIGALLLLMLGLWAWLGVLAGRIHWSPPMASWAIAVAIMGLVWAMHLTDDQGKLIAHSLGLDRCVKYLLVLIAMPALLMRRPSAAALRWGCAVGAIGAGLTALWQILVLRLDRADGYTNAIQFGNLALLLGVWSGIWALHACTPREKAVGWLGAVFGLTASLASGSRGGWIMLPLLMLLGLWFSRPARPVIGWHGLRALGMTAAVCTALAMLPPVQQRAELARQEYQRHEQQMDNSSIGLRLAFWRLAWEQGKAHPWIGIGQTAYEKRQREAVARHEMPFEAVLYNHAHNEWLDMFAKRGLLGVLGLLLFYGVPGILFWRSLRAIDLDVPGAAARRAAALCGLTAVAGFVGFGLTQVMFGHNNGNLMYLLPVSLWLAVCSHGARAARGGAHDPGNGS